MSKREKRLLKIRQNPKNVTFQELSTILESYGFILKRSTGSHHSFQINIGDLELLVVIPFARPVGIAYVKEAIKLIDEIRAQSKLDEDEA